MEKDIICVVCPSSCHIHVVGEGNEIKEITGFTCNRGKEYATAEFVAPKRTVTTTVKAKKYVSPVIPVRTDKPIPKELMMECMDILNSLVVEEPFEIGRVVVENILGSGVNVILCNC